MLNFVRLLSGAEYSISISTCPDPPDSSLAYALGKSLNLLSIELRYTCDHGLNRLTSGKGDAERKTNCPYASSLFIRSLAVLSPAGIDPTVTLVEVPAAAY